MIDIYFLPAYATGYSEEYSRRLSVSYKYLGLTTYAIRDRALNRKPHSSIKLEVIKCDDR